MKVFVTGATGWIGSALVPELIGAGHEVVGLARSDEAAAKLEAAGAGAHRGELSDPDGVAEGARACDGVIHAAFIHDFSRYQENADTDRRVLGALADALAGSGRPLVATSGTMMAPAGRLVRESDVATPESPGYIRSASEAFLPAAERGVRTAVVRLAPTVHGEGDTAFVPALVDVARRTGVAAYVGLGANRWPAVHRDDAARLFRLALERAEPGTRLHGAAEEGVPMRAIAEVIGGGLGVPTRSLTPEQAAEHFGWLAMFVGVDGPASSAATREAVGWRPEGPDLLTDMRRHYFR